MKSKLFLPLLLIVVFAYGFNIRTSYYIPTSYEKVTDSHVVRVYDATTGKEITTPGPTENSTYIVDIWLYGWGHDKRQVPSEKKHSWQFQIPQLPKPEEMIHLSVLPGLMTRKKEFDFIQPAHIYKPEGNIGHIYMPTSLLSMAARLQQSGVAVKIWDENFGPYKGTNSTVGINLLGAPYIPVVRELIARVNTEQILLGGQVINGLSNEELSSLFPGCVNGNNPITFGHGGVPSQYETSLIPMYEQIPDWQMKAYLEHEFSFFVSQGCKQACKFCAAVRTHKDPATGEVIKITEQYRNTTVMEKDFSYLLSRAQKLGVKNIQIYMSNLDVFQTPEKLRAFADMVLRTKGLYPTVAVELRALATVESFLDCAANYPETVERLREAGYTTTGFGVDGGTAEVWKKIGKAHNFSSLDADAAKKSIDAIKISWERFQIKPEMLMVFGHLHVDTEESLKAAVTLTEDMVQLYNAVPRPHVAKNFIPGNDHWRNPANKKQLEIFLKHPWLFQGLDFCALATSYTHENTEFADMVNKYYLEICNIPGNTTQPIYPVIPEMSGTEIKDVSKEAIEMMLSLNASRYDR